MTRVLAIGDVVGRAGRRCLERFLDKARQEIHPDIVLVNAENAAGGFGLTKKIYHQLTDKLNIDCLTMGNHWHDKREIYKFMDEADRMVLPGNMNNIDPDDEERGLRLVRAPVSGAAVAVINVVGRAFMSADNRCPYKTVDRLLERIPPSVKIRIVDFHAEATSEKQGMGWYLAGRASLVYGTHCHVPTADERIVGDATGFITDLGMTGAYESVIGIRRQSALRRLLTGEKKRFEPAAADPWFSAVVADIEDESGKCRSIERLLWKQDEMEGPV